MVVVMKVYIVGMAALLLGLNAADDLGHPVGGTKSSASVCLEASRIPGTGPKQMTVALVVAPL